MKAINYRNIFDILKQKFKNFCTKLTLMSFWF